MGRSYEHYTRMREENEYIQPIESPLVRLVISQINLKDDISLEGMRDYLREVEEEDYELICPTHILQQMYDKYCELMLRLDTTPTNAIEHTWGLGDWLFDLEGYPLTPGDKKEINRFIQQRYVVEWELYFTNRESDTTGDVELVKEYPFDPQD